MTALYYSFICVYHSFLQFCPVLLLSSCLPPITAFILSVSQLFQVCLFSVSQFSLCLLIITAIFIYICITTLSFFALHHSLIFFCPLSQLSSHFICIIVIFMSALYHSFLQVCPVLQLFHVFPLSQLKSCLPCITAFLGLPYISITVFFMSAHYHSDLHIYLYHNFIFLCPVSQLYLFLPCITAFFIYSLYHTYLHVCPVPLFPLPEADSLEQQRVESFCFHLNCS